MSNSTIVNETLYFPRVYEEPVSAWITILYIFATLYLLLTIFFTLDGVTLPSLSEITNNTSNEKCALLMGIPFSIIMLAVAVTGAFQSFDGIEIVMGSTAVNIFIGIILLFRSRIPKNQKWKTSQIRWYLSATNSVITSALNSCTISSVRFC